MHELPAAPGGRDAYRDKPIGPEPRRHFGVHAEPLEEPIAWVPRLELRPIQQCGGGSGSGAAEHPNAKPLRMNCACVSLSQIVSSSDICSLHSYSAAQTRSYARARRQRGNADHVRLRARDACAAPECMEVRVIFRGWVGGAGREGPTWIFWRREVESALISASSSASG